MLWIQDLVRAHTLGVPRAIGGGLGRAVIHGIDSDVYVFSPVLFVFFDRTDGYFAEEQRIGDLLPSRVHSRTLMEVWGYRYVC